MYDVGGGMGGPVGGMQGHGGMYGAYPERAPRQRSSKTGPDPEILAQILTRTGYPHETSPSLRRYGGPPPDWTGPKPTQGVEVGLLCVPCRFKYFREFIGIAYSSYFVSHWHLSHIALFSD